jgi:ABC-2 type transport system permease protein
MRTLSVIIRYDWKNLSAERTLWLIAALLAAALAYGAQNGARWVQFQQQVLDKVAKEEQERLRRLEHKLAQSAPSAQAPPPFLDPTQPSAVGRRLGAKYAALPPAPLAPLAVGQTDILPYYVKVTTGPADSFLNNDEIEHPAHLLSGRFDLTFVIVYLYPLLIFALTYNVLSGEKESGVLQMTLSQPVGLRRLLTGKILARFTFVTAFAAGLLALAALWVDLSLPSSDWWIRLGLWFLTVILYGAFWFAVSASINALGWNSALCAAALTGLWILLVLVLPALLNLYVRSAHPLPSRVEYVNAMRQATLEASQQGAQLLARYLEDHPELASSPANRQDFAVISIAMQNHVEEAVQPVLQRFESQLEVQQRITDRLRFLSPALLCYSLLTDFAGAGNHRHRHFVALVRRFHQQWRNWFVPRIVRGVRFERHDVASLPSFRFIEEAPSAVMGRALPALGGLAAMFFLAVAPAIWLIGRYPIAT